MYEGKGHDLSDKQFPADVLEFVRRRPAVQSGPDAEQQSIADQPSVTSGQPAGPSPVVAGAG
jgi:hypothetical protein